MKLKALVAVVAMALVLAGCYAMRWSEFDKTMQSEVGIKTKEYYLAKWGEPTKAVKLEDGGEVLVWERDEVAANRRQQKKGWRKTLIFRSDGVLKDYDWQYWGAPLISF
jgi:hypothetical protein